ncbi:thiol:disulfide interchange protein [hot springs metagenome]|uniref:Thiol:disulfide interchange protein n=2 Tax=hot springs metagenome TaxID=433727 RepID=A0A5J4L5G4_9ZZZZ
MALCLFSTNAFAGETMPIDIPKTEALQKILSATNSKLKEVNDIGSVYEVVTERNDQKKVNVLYLTKDKKYIIGGALFDSNLRNITKERLDELNKVDFSNLPLDNAIVVKRGNGTKKLVMVTDVDCPFCKKAWEWLKTQNNYTLYVFLSPIEQLHPNAKDKSIKILCSNDVAKALDNVKSGKTLNAKNCEAGTAKLAEHVLVSEVIGVTGTPVFVLGDGRKIEGFNKPVIENYFSGGNNEK